MGCQEAVENLPEFGNSDTFDIAGELPIAMVFQM